MNQLHWMDKSYLWAGIWFGFGIFLTFLYATDGDV